MMNGYDVTKRAIEFSYPDRMPICYNCYQPDLRGEVVFVFTEKPKTWKPSIEGMDEWGCQWLKMGENSGLIVDSGQVLDHPLKDYADLNKISFPDPYDLSRYTQLDAYLKEVNNKYIVFCNGSAFFERMHYLRGLVNLLEDLYINRKMVEDLADRVLEFQLGTLEVIGKMFKGRIHGFRLTDDWGLQHRLMISPQMWREIFKPRYKKLFDAVHSKEMHIWLHSCGKINEIIEDFVEMELDVINLAQPRLLDIEEIGRKFSGKICFESHPDLQVTLPKGNLMEIGRDVQEILEHFGSERGGFILGDWGPMKGLTAETNEKIRKMFREYYARVIETN